MKEMLARHKGKLILSSLVILLPILPAAFAGQTLFLWEPVLLLVSQWVIMLVVLHANRNKEQSPKVLNLVAWILPCCPCCWASWASLPRAARIRPTLSPRCSPSSWVCCFSSSATICPRQSRTAPWASASSGLWKARKTGTPPPLRWEALVPGRPAADGLRPHPQRADGDSSLVCHPAAMVILPTRYSYRFYKSQVAEGKVEKSPVKPRSIVLIAVLVLAFGAFLPGPCSPGTSSMSMGRIPSPWMPPAGGT